MDTFVLARHVVSPKVDRRPRTPDPQKLVFSSKRSPAAWRLALFSCLSNNGSCSIGFIASPSPKHSVMGNHGSACVVYVAAAI